MNADGIPAPSGWRTTKAGVVAAGGVATYFRRGDDLPRRPGPRKPKPAADAPQRNLQSLADRFVAQLDDTRCAELAAQLGVASDAVRRLYGLVTSDDLRTLKAGFAGGGDYPYAYAVPERDADGTIIGFSLRAPDGRKGFFRGMRRGVTVPVGFADMPDPVFVVEGASDVAALLTVGLTAVGRPSNTGGADILIKLLAGREVIVLGERDMKGDGATPGLTGAKTLARKAADAWGNPIVWALPLDGLKDSRAWVRSLNLDLADGVARKAAGAKILEHVRANANIVEPASAGQAVEGRPHLAVRSLYGIKPQSVEWLWRDRIPLGKLTIIAGLGDQGKSFITHSVGAVVSAGYCWPLSNDRATVGDVVYLANEDGVEDTIVPRLTAAGADMKRVSVIEGVVRERGAEPDWVRLDTDVRFLDDTLAERPECRLLVIDPITAYLGEAESHKDADVRRVLGPLAQLAERRRVAVVAVHHWNKARGMSATLRGTGSAAFANLARSVLIAASDPRDSTRRVLAVAKMNLAEKPTSLAFRIGGDPPTVNWIPGVPDISADALALTWGESGGGGAAEDGAIEFLRGALADGPVLSKSLQADAQAEGLAKGALWAAKDRLGVRARKLGFNGAWEWRLPVGEASDPLPSTDSLDASAGAIKNAVFRPEYQDSPDSSAGAIENAVFRPASDPKNHPGASASRSVRSVPVLGSENPPGASASRSVQSVGVTGKGGTPDPAPAPELDGPDDDAPEPGSNDAPDGDGPPVDQLPAQADAAPTGGRWIRGVGVEAIPDDAAADRDNGRLFDDGGKAPQWHEV
jgi:hypothetical protein